MNIARAAAATALLVLSVPGCSSIQLPWQHHSPSPGPSQADVLRITQMGAPAAFPQYWKRNTLLVDLQSISGSGRIVLKPKTEWPIRLALRVTPGSVGVLEVYSDQRSILPITPAGTQPVDLELDPSLYTLKTEQIAVTWRPASPATP